MSAKLARFFLYAAPFALTIVMPSIFFPFIGGKYWFFRTCVELAASATLVALAFGDSDGRLNEELKKIWRNPLVIAVTIFAGAFLLACFLGYDPVTSFWSNYERGEGGFQMIHYWTFFILLVLHFRDSKHWRTFFWCSLVAALWVIFYGLGAAAGWAGFVGPYAQEGNSFIFKEPNNPNGVSFSSFLFSLFSDSRFQGSLGNAVYVGPYLIFCLGYLAWLYVSKNRKPLWLLAVSAALATLFCIIFLTAQSRGAFLGLSMAVFTYLLILAVSNRKWRMPVLICIFALVAIFAVLYMNREQSFVRALPISRILDISIFSGNAQTRIWDWMIAWRGFKDHPLLGWGPENYPAVFDKYFNPKYYTPKSVGETWFDRAHSVFFDYLAETGLVGLLAYLSIFATAGFVFLKLIRSHSRKSSDKENKDDNLSSVLSWAVWPALILAYLIQGVFAFDVLPIFINVLIVLAAANWQLGELAPVHRHASEENQKPRKKIEPDPIWQGTALALAFLFLIAGWYGNFLPMVKAESYISNLGSLKSSQTWEDFRNMFDATMNLPSPFGDEEIKRNLGNVILAMIGQDSKGNYTMVRTVSDYIDSYLSPLVSRGKGSSFGQTVFIAGAVEQTAFNVTGDKYFFDKAENYFKNGLDVSPSRPQFLYGLFDLYERSHNKDGAVAIGQEIIKLWPQDSDTAQAVSSLTSAKK